MSGFGLIAKKKGGGSNFHYFFFQISQIPNFLKV